MRTTVDLDEPVLASLKAIQKRERKSLGRVISDLLVAALSDRKRKSRSAPEPFEWMTQAMGARVEVADREAVYELMDADHGR